MPTMIQTAAAEFAIGDGATFSGWSDAKAGTIIAASAKRITWQRDKATLQNGANSGAADALTFSPGGFCGHTEGRQRYEYERDETGMTMTFTLRKNGKWIAAGDDMCRGRRLRAGRNEFYDFNF